MSEKVKYNTIVNFSVQLAALIKANLPLVNALSTLSKEMEDKTFKRKLEEIKEDVSRGVDFGDAMSEHKNIFDNLYINMVKAGMKTGKLGNTLTQLSEYLTKVAETREKIKSALSYPIFMLIFMLITTLIQLMVVLPKFEGIFSSFGKELPGPTLLLINISHFLRDYWYLIAAIVGSIIFAIISFLKTENGRYLWDEHKLKIPIVGPLMYKSSMAKMTRTLGVLTENEVPILDAMELVVTSSDNVFIEDKLLTVKDGIERGKLISESFKDAEIFPDIIPQMLSSGEQSGTLPFLLLSCSNFYDNQVDETLKSIVSLVQPTITVVMGLVIGGIMIAMFLPIFDMGSVMKH